MSDNIIDLIAAHRPYGIDCKCGEPINSDEAWARHLHAALNDAGHHFWHNITPEEEAADVW